MQNDEDWEDELNDLKMIQISNEISEAENYLNMLEIQKRDLLNKLDSLTDEQDINIKVLPAITVTTSPRSGSFFEAVQKLENLKKELEVQYITERKISQDLSHQIIILQQKLKKSKRDLDFHTQKLESEEHKAIINDDLLKYEDDQLNQINIIHEAEANTCKNLKNELTKLTKAIQDDTRESVNEIKEKILILQDEYDDKQLIEMKLKDDLKALQIRYKRDQDDHSRLVNKAKEIKYMQNTRIYLDKKIRQLDEQLRIQRNDLITAQAREKNIHELFIKMFPNDQGDGSCEEIRALVQGKINSIMKKVPYQLYEELQIEDDYSEELTKQMNKIQRTLQIIEQNHEEAKRSLLQELKDCKTDGYVQLLKREMDEIQQKAAKL